MKMETRRKFVFWVLIFITTLTSCFSSEINTSILNDDVKITITDENEVVLRLNKGDGKSHLLKLGERIPLIGEAEWSLEPNRFQATWENGIQLVLTAENDVKGVRRLKTSWRAPSDILTLQQCIDLGADNWYGGTELYNQPWPMQQQTFGKVAYVTGANGAGTVLAPYFLSSASIAYFAAATKPLFVSLGTEVANALCLTAEFNSPYRNTNNRQLILDIDTSWNDPANMLSLWYADSQTHFGHPSKAASQKVSNYPIWSTWAVYKSLINQDKVLQFAQDIYDQGYSASQIEIDDNWETCYGNEVFDPAKFADPAAMVSQIKSLGFDVTLWIHPFVNTNCETFDEGVAGGYFVTVNGTVEVGITSWWDGAQAGLIDITNSAARDWWQARLSKLVTDVGITAFKFDAGESSWLPQNAYLHTEESLQPGSYAPHYTDFAKQFGDQVEARVGYFSQTQGGIFVRLLDRDSVWGLNNGLQSVITSTLHFGIVGYPFVLPDYIGGNAYGAWPDRELFIRWAQLNAFLPVMQFSILPWSYDDEVNNITKNMVQLHQSISPVLDAAVSEALDDGSPIIRPLWWLDWSDVTAQTVNDEFLVGNTYLVAPVVTQGAVERDIYVPTGNWSDMLRGGTVVGPTWLNNYSVALNEIAYFRNVNA